LATEIALLSGPVSEETSNRQLQITDDIRVLADEIVQIVER
jgi:hypothetical protein